ncbi:MAG: hypothetical protein KF726_02465 [Anaerolineae bacterium]|nr:hypothetical protein [Anaerolineae bacterium]
MSNRTQAPAKPKPGTKYPLLIYRDLANRFRPAAILMFVAGLVAQIPRFIPEARLEGTILSYEQLSWLGALLLLIGLALWIAAIYRERRAYVQCRAEGLRIRTAGSKITVPYNTINVVKPVRVGDLFPRESLKGNLRFARSHLAETAVEMVISQPPIPMEKLRRRLHPLVLSPREQGFVFLVAYPTKLTMEIDNYLEQTRRMYDADSQRYLDPIERAAYVSSGRRPGRDG